MKDKRLYLFSGILFTALFSIFITTCEVGLGEAVDINAPTVSITYPPASSIIRNTFVLAGVCNDDVSVESVTVTVRNTERNENYGPYKATVSKDSWRLNINQSGGRFNGWEMSDGRYVAEVYATDAAGRKSGVTSIPFDVDNTAPLFILSKPGSTDHTNPTKYGTSLKIAGTIADDHTVARMNLKLYDESSCAKNSGETKSYIVENATPINGTDGWTESNIETAGGTEIVFANKNGSEEQINRFNEIYPSSQTGDKVFGCKIELSDSAKVYNNPGESSNTSQGNTTNAFYKYDDVYSEWLSSASGLDASAVKKIVNGTKTADGSIDETKINSVKDDYQNKKSYVASFSLNPDANPKYKVFGFGSNSITSIPGNNKASGGQQITINLAAGLNGTLVKPETMAVYQFGPYETLRSAADVAKMYTAGVDEFNAYYASQREGETKKAYLLAYFGSSEDDLPEYTIDGFAEGKTINSYSYSSGSVESDNESVDLTSSLEANEYYYIVVKAKDADGAYANVSADAQIYAFRGYSTDSPPVLTWYEKGTTGYENVASDQGIVVNTWTGDNVTTGMLTFSGLLENTDGLNKITTLTYSGTRKDETGTEADTTYTNVDITSSLNRSSGYWSFSLPAVTNAGKRYIYNITVTATNNASLSDSKTRKFYVDTLKPAVTINSVTPHVDKTESGVTTSYLNGTFNITGSVDESNLENVWYEIWSGDNTSAVYTSPMLGAKYTISTGDIQIDSTETDTYHTTNEEAVNVIVYAKDKAGNIGSKSTTEFNSNQTYRIDQSTDKPQVSGSNFCIVSDTDNLSPDADFENGKGNIFDKTTNHKLIGTVEDDDGIESIMVNVYSEDLSLQKSSDSVGGFNIGTITASFTYNGLPVAPGVYWVEIIATDVTYIESLSPDVMPNTNRQTKYGASHPADSSRKGFFVAIDNSNPRLSETAIGTEDRKYVREDDTSTPDVNEAAITFSGKASDDWDLTEVEVSVSAADHLEDDFVNYVSVKIAKVVDETNNTVSWKQYQKDLTTSGADYVEVTGDAVNFTMDASGNWSHTPDVSGFPSGFITFVFTATDKAGKTTTLTRNVCKDIVAPVFGDSLITELTATGYNAISVKPYITNSKSNGWYNTTTLSVSGGVSDNLSGVKKVEYTLNPSAETVTWTELSGTSTFGGVIANVPHEAIATITLRATDVAGNSSTTTIEGILIDIDVPSAVVTSIDGQTTGIGNILSNGNNPISITGTAEDAKSGISEIKISVGSKDFSSANVITVPSSSITQVTGSTTQYNWSATIPAEKITTSGTVWAQIKDGAGNTSELNLFSLQFDNNDPEVDFNDTIKNSTVNKLITISGTANDDQKLDSIKLEYQSGVTGSGSSATPVWSELTKDGTAAESAPASKKVSGTYNWKLVDVDTEIAFGSTIYDCNSTKAGTQVKLRVTATDAAGNTKTAETEITVDQNTDRPVISFTNVPSLAGMNATTYPFLNNSSLMGTITDDDEINSSVVFKMITKLWDTTVASPVAPDAPTPAEWTAAPSINLSGGSFTATISSQGKQDIYFYVKDSKGEEFISKIIDTSSATDSYNSVYLKDGTNTFGDEKSSTNNSSIMHIRLDTMDPESSGIGYNLYSLNSAAYRYSASQTWDDSVSGKIFGGDTSKFAVKLTANDANGIRSVTGIMGETEQTQGYHEYDFTYTGSDSTYKNGEWKLEDVLTGNGALTGNLKDGVNYFTIKVTDNAGRERSSTVQLTVDNTKPEITIKIPEENSQATVSGEINVYGSLSEVCKVYYALSTSGTVSPDDDTTAITQWIKHETESTPKTNVTIKDSNGATVDIKDRINYSSQIKGTTTEWYVYFDGDADDSQALTHTKLFNEYLVDYGITTSEALASTESDKFEDIVDIYLWIKAIDTAGNVTEKTQAIYLDPQGDRPTVAISYPEKDGDVLGGTIKLYGEASDNKYVETVWVQMISQKEHLNASGTPVNWNENKDSDIIRYTETTSTDASGKTVYSYSNVFKKFEPTMADLDMLAEKGYNVYKIDTYNPSASNNQKWVKGTSTLGSGEKASDYGILANFSGSTWNIKINENGELNPTGDGENIVALRLISKDGDGKKSVYANRIFKIDNDKPIFGSTQPFYVVKSSDVTFRALENEPASREYSEDMFVKDSWYLIGSVEDDVGIKTLKLKNNKTNQTTTLVENSAAKAGGTVFSAVVDGRVVKFKYKLETASGVGSLDFTLEAEDVADGQPHSQTKDVKIHYDNTAPELVAATDASYKISPSVKQTNNFYVFGSSVKENAVSGSNQSGFDYVAFYFMRRSDRTTDSKNYLYDVMLPRSKTTGTGDTAVTDNNYNKIDLAGSDITYEDGLYWKSKTVTRDSANLGKLTMTAEDKNVHKGGIVKIGGTVYLINSVSGKDVTVDGNVPVGYTNALFACSMIVNNTVTEGESGSIQDDGYYLQPSNDDGDRMIESVKKSGTTWAWEADICSKNIPDGPIELHYVAFDKAGNYSIGIMGYVPATATAGVTGSYAAYTTPDATSTPTYSVYAYNSASPAFVCNNQPRIAGVIFGTDDNGDGNVTDGSVVGGKKTANEFITTYSGWYDTSSSNKATGVTVNGKDERGNSVTTFDIPNDLSDSAITIKGRTIIKPEIVGGNNGLSYTYSVTKNGAASAYYNSASIELSDEDSSTDDIRTGIVIDLTTQKLLTKDSSNKTIDDGQKQVFAFKIWDKTEGTVAGTTSQFATINLVANVVLKDSDKAKVWLKPFLWKLNTTTNSIDNSLYYETVSGKKTAQGHIELESDWIKTDSYKNANPEGGTAVTSGINDKDPKVSGKIALRGRATDNVRVNEIHLKVPGFTTSDGFIQVARRNATSGEWESLGTMADNGWEFVLDGEEQFSQSGNVVDFIIYWDTAQISSVAKHDVAVEVMARDKGSVSLAANGTDLVYTTTGNSVASSTQTVESEMTPYYKMDVVPYITSIKTELSVGKRPTVLSRSALGVYPVRRGSNITVEGYNLNGTSSKVKIGSTEYTPINGSTKNSLIITTNGNTTSSAVVAMVGTVGSLNNETIKSVEYNQEPNDQNNDMLTDARRLHVVDVYTTTNTDDKRMLDMAVIGDDLYFSAGYGADYFATMRANEYDIDTVSYLRQSFTRYFDNAMAISGTEDSFTLYTISACGDSYNAVSSWDNGPSHLALTKGAVAQRNRWEYGTIGNGGQNPSNNSSKLYLESNWNGANLNNLDRFKNPDIVMKTVNSQEQGVISYYDTTQKLIKFRYFTPSTTKVASNLASYQAGATSSQIVEGAVNTNANYSQGYTAIAGANENSSYSAVNVTSGGAAVVAWYDAENGALKMKYNTNPAESFSGYQTFDTVPSTGTVTFKIAVDGGAAKDVSVSWSNVASGARNNHEFAYKLNEVLSNGYGSYAEVDPRTNRVTVRSMQTGTNSKIAITGLSSGAVGTAVAGAGQPWNLVTVDEDSAGQYVAMKTDSKGGIHFAYYDTGNGDLKYAYMSSVTATPKVVTVDGYQQVGQYVDLALKETTSGTVTNVTPYISYYSMSNADSKRSVKVAKLASPVKYTTGTTVTVDSSAVLDGSDDELFTGKWEAMHIPTNGAPVQYRVNVGVTSSGNVYISYLVDRTIEYVKVE